MILGTWRAIRIPTQDNPSSVTDPGRIPPIPLADCVDNSSIQPSPFTICSIVRSGKASTMSTHTRPVAFVGELLGDPVIRVLFAGLAPRYPDVNVAITDEVARDLADSLIQALDRIEEERGGPGFRPILPVAIDDVVDLIEQLHGESNDSQSGDPDNIYKRGISQGIAIVLEGIQDLCQSK